MEIPEFVATLDQEGRSLAAATEAAGFDAKVAACPDWQVRDLVRHTGMVRVRATDADAVWTVRLSAQPPVSKRGEHAGGDADCEVAGPAARLYLALWNRLRFSSMSGDAALAALWREKSEVTWS
ncbi:maleylpyruvate isomerase N-terminal domain-containing protein [Streptomyces sp. SD15]